MQARTGGSFARRGRKKRGQTRPAARTGAHLVKSVPMQARVESRALSGAIHVRSRPQVQARHPGLPGADRHHLRHLGHRVLHPHARRRATRWPRSTASTSGSASSQQELRRQQEQLRRMFGGAMDPAMLDSPEMRRSVLEAMIGQRLVQSEAARAHMFMTREAVIEAITNAPDFQEDGKFSPAKYSAYLAAQGVTDQGNVANLQSQIPLARMAGAIADTAIAPRSVVSRIAALEAQRREVSDVRLEVKQFLPQVKVTTSRSRRTTTPTRPTTARPERVRAEYVVLSAEALARQDPPTESRAPRGLRGARQPVPRRRAAPREPHPGQDQGRGRQVACRGEKKSRSLRRAGQEELAGPGLGGEGRRPRLVRPRHDGEAVRGRGVQARPERDAGGGERVRLPRAARHRHRRRQVALLRGSEEGPDRGDRRARRASASSPRRPRTSATWSTSRPTA